MAKELTIKSPVGFDPAIYYWPNVSAAYYYFFHHQIVVGDRSLSDRLLPFEQENQDNNGASEIIETIKCVYEDFPELNGLFSKERLHDYDSKR